MGLIGHLSIKQQLFNNVLFLVHILESDYCLDAQEPLTLGSHMQNFEKAPFLIRNV